MASDHLSVARAIVDSMHAPRYDQPSGQRIKPGLEERTARATEAIAYTTLAIAEELRAHRTPDRIDDQVVCVRADELNEICGWAAAGLDESSALPLVGREQVKGLIDSLRKMANEAGGGEG